MTIRPVLLALLLAAPLGLAGCLSTEEPGATAEPAGSVLATPPAEIPVSLDGSIGVFAMVCPVVACVGRTLVGETTRIFPQEDLSGDVAAVNLTMEWAAGSPLTETLRLGVFTCPKECGGDSDLTQFFYVDGVSPLTLTTDPFTIAEGESLFVFAWVPSLTPAPTYTVLTTPQDFHIEGTFTPGASSAAADPVLVL